ncbi:TraQ conjugal transfer family protein [Elizabethkingia ursingii]
MKKTFFIFLSILSLFLFNSCRSDGDWGNNQTNGQFGFTVERDKDFQEKAVGETTDIKFNIKANYDFATVPMVIKYSGDLNGVLKLGDLVLEQNKEYELKSASNILKYTGNEAGTHKLKISAKNAKDQSQTEEFELKYAVSDFKVDVTTGSTEYYQGQEINYPVKITPAKNTDTKGYFIKFNAYDGVVKLNGVQVDLGKEYEIINIDNFSISTTTSKAGQGKLTYTIKNKTTSRDLEIQQNIKKREINIESMNVQPQSVVPNTEISLVGIVKKAPIKDNNNIKYKTWITEATDNNLTGIVTTNNSFVDYALSSNGDINIKMLAKDAGNYMLNFQAQDEFGNLSDVKQFKIVVEAPLAFIGEAATTFTYHYSQRNITKVGCDFVNWKKTFRVKAGAGQKITKVEYQLNYNVGNRDFNLNASEIVNSQDEVNYSNQDVGGPGFIGEWSFKEFLDNLGNAKGTLKIIVTTDKGAVLEKTINATMDLKNQ